MERRDFTKYLWNGLVLHVQTELRARLSIPTGGSLGVPGALGGDCECFADDQLALEL